MNECDNKAAQSSEFLRALRKGTMLGLAVLVLVMPQSHRGVAPAIDGEKLSASGFPAFDTLAKAPDSFADLAPPNPKSVQLPTPLAPVPVQPAAVPSPPRKQASFGKEWASSDVRHVANWAFYSADNRGKSVVVVDKRDARVYVFDPEGTLVSSTAALLGSAVGDHTVPGVGDKPLSQVTPEERTTPAGRFVAEPGMNTNGEDVIWVDYDAAVSMHRVRPHVRSERRLERLASSTPDDNRISYGCINLPVAFYEQVLSPTVRRTGAVIYVLPEVKSVQALFGSFDVPRTALFAQR